MASRQLIHLGLQDRQKAEERKEFKAESKRIYWP